MNTSTAQSGLFNPRILVALTLCAVSVFLASLGFATNPTPGSWSLITSPSVNATSNNLDDVTCASASDCWAVGSYLNSQSAYPQTLIEHWNGIAWSIVSSPNTSPTQTNGLDEVACASASDCWAVGNYTYYYNSFPFATPYSQTLIEHWNGTTWTIVESPNTSSTENNSLSGVACASASDCWAVGSTIQHWNGTSWSILASPSGGFLNSVTCLSGSDCWAVGSALIEHWDGGSWAVVPGAGGSSLLGVTCSSASDCWAVGGNGGQSLIEHWDGTSWAVVASPGTEGSLSDVTCATPSECWATGESDEAGDTGNTFTLVEYWNGSSWAIVSSPSPSSRTNPLIGVTCASTSECWAVGWELNGTTGHIQTLVEEFAPTIPPLTGVVSRMTHGGSRTFDIDLPLIGTLGVECRSGGANGNYQVVFSFVNNVTSCGSASTGSLSSGPSPNQCTVNLTGVPNAQYITVTLNNVLDSQNNTGNVAATMGVLLGDTTGNGSVNASDISQTKAQSGTAATATNFRTDVTVNGQINASDISTVKSKSGTALP